MLQKHHLQGWKLYGVSSQLVVLEDQLTGGI